MLRVLLDLTCNTCYRMDIFYSNKWYNPASLFSIIINDPLIIQLYSFTHTHTHTHPYIYIYIYICIISLILFKSDCMIFRWIIWLISTHMITTILFSVHWFPPDLNLFHQAWLHHPLLIGFHHQYIIHL